MGDITESKGLSDELVVVVHWWSPCFGTHQPISVETGLGVYKFCNIDSIVTDGAISTFGIPLS